MQTKKNLTPVAIALVSMCFSTGALADTSRLLFHTSSKHFDSSSYDWNEVNPGLGYVSNKGLTFGAYKNSNSDTSVYAGWDTRLAHTKYVDFGAVVGAVSGYKQGALLPFLHPYISVATPIDRVNALFGAAPYIYTVETKENNATKYGVVVTFSLEFRSTL